MAFKIVSQTVSEVEDRDPNLYVQRAEDFLKKQQYSAALKEMDTAINYAPQNKKNSYIFEKFKVYEAIGKDDSCVDFIKKHIRTLYSYLSLSDFYRVLSLLQRNEKPYSNALQTILWANNLPIVLCETYRSSSNTSGNYFINLARDYKAKKQYENALGCISVVDDKYGENVDSSLLKGQIFRAKGLLGEAMAHYTRTVNLPGVAVDVYMEIVSLCLELKQTGEAKRWIETGLRKFPRNPDLLHQKAEIFYEQGQYDDCLQTLDIMITDNPNNAKAIHLKGLVFDQKGKYLKSNWFFKKANKLNHKLIPPSNQSRDKFLFRLKILIITGIALLVLLVIGQFMMFKTGKIKPFIGNVKISMHNHEKVFVGETVPIYDSFNFYPFYAPEPETKLVVVNPEIGKLDSKNHLKGLKSGTSTIELVWGNKVLGTKKVQVVKPSVAELNLELSNDQLEVGDSTKLNADIQMDYDKAKPPTATFSSSNPDVVEVDQNGEILANGVGQADISVKAGGVIKTKTVTVKAKVEDIILSESEISLQIGQTYPLKPTVITSPANEETWPLRYASSDSSVATVDENGQINALKSGETVITISSVGRVEKTVKVTIKPDGVTSLTGRYDESSNQIILEWDYTNSQSDENVSFSIDVTLDGNTSSLTTTSEKFLNFSNPNRGATYTFTVTPIIDGTEIDPATTSVEVPEAENSDLPNSQTENTGNTSDTSDTINDTGSSNGTGDSSAEQIQQDQDVNKMEELLSSVVGYWKNTNQNVNDWGDFRYAVIGKYPNGGPNSFKVYFPGLSYARTFESTYSEDDIRRNITKVEGNKLYDDQGSITIEGPNKFILEIKDGPTGDSNTKTYTFLRCNKSDIPSDYINHSGVLP